MLTLPYAGLVVYEDIFGMLDIIEKLDIKVILPHFLQIEESGVSPSDKPVIQIICRRQTLSLVTYEHVVMIHCFLIKVAFV